MEAKIKTIKAVTQQLLKIKNIKSESSRKQGEKLRLQASFTKILLCKQISRRLIIHPIRISALKWLLCLIWWNVGCFYSKVYIHMRCTQRLDQKWKIQICLQEMTKDGQGTLCNSILLHGKNKIFLGCYLCSFIFMFVFHFVLFFY